MNLKFALRCICEAMSGQIGDGAIRIDMQEVNGVEQLVIYSNFIKTQVKKLIVDELNLNFLCFKTDHGEKMATPGIKYLESETKFTLFMLKQIVSVEEGMYIFTNLNESKLMYKGIPINEAIYNELYDDVKPGLYDDYEEQFEETI